MSLRKQFLIAVTAAVVAIVVTAGALSWLASRSAQLETISAHGSRIARQVAYLLAHTGELSGEHAARARWQWRERHKLVGDLIEHIDEAGTLQRVGHRDVLSDVQRHHGNAGRLLHQLSDSPFPRQGESYRLQAQLITGRLVAEAQLMAEDAFQLTRVVETEADRMEQYARATGLGALGLMGVLLVVQGLVFAVRLLRPLAALETAASEAENGNFTATLAGAERNDELGHSIRAFNSMLAALHTRDRELRESYVRLRDVADERDRIVRMSPDPLAVISENDTIAQANPAWSDVLGLPVEHFVGRPLSQLVHADDLAATGAALNDARTTGKAAGFVNRCLAADRTYRWVEWRVSATPRRVVFAVARDITERYRLENELQLVVDRMPLGIVYVTVDRKIRLCNRAYARLLGREPADIVGQRIADVVGDSAYQSIRPHLDRALGGDEVVFDRQLLDERGASRMLEVHYVAERDPAGTVVGALALVEDVTHSREELEALNYAARHDTLTGLLNRSGLEAALGSQLATDASHCVVMIDLDGFKPINDTLGHAAGDEALRAVAGILGDCVRASDLVARQGGDEFVVVLPGCPPERATEIAGDIVARIGGLAFGQRDRDPLRLGASVGVTPSPGDEPLDAALARADEACYRAKRQGGGRLERVGWSSPGSDQRRHYGSPGR